MKFSDRNHFLVFGCSSYSNIRRGTIYVPFLPWCGRATVKIWLYIFYFQVADLQQRKCSVIFDISCNLARILEFCTREIPCAFLAGSDMNLRRLTELVVFILNHIISAANAEFFDMWVITQYLNLKFLRAVKCPYWKVWKCAALLFL
jgi:hypothetical protein